MLIGLIQEGSLVPLSPATLFFNDLPESEASEWVGKLLSQPAEGWTCTTTYCGWREVPSVYIVCEKDAVLPQALQEQFAAIANSRLERINAGHMPHISQPEQLSRLIIEAAQSLVPI